MIRPPANSAYLNSSSLIIFLVLCINKLGFNLSGGEEQYLAMAKEFMDPQWVPDSFTLTEFAGTRIVFQTIMGTFLKWFDFETVTFFARLINFALFSIPLGILFRKLKISNVAIFIVFQLFVMSKQSLFGLEWIFNTFEPKTLSYFFLFCGLNNVLNEKYKRAVILLAVATYFHVLVGGWFFITLLIFMVLTHQVKEAGKALLYYCLFCLPFALYLYYGYFLNPNPETTLNLDFLYVYYRLPHHLGIFKSMDYFLKYHALGVLLSLSSFILGLWMFKKQDKGLLRSLNLLMLIMLAINLLFVVVAWIDHSLLNSSGGLLLKYYPFRTNSLAMFFLFILLFNWGKDLLSGYRYYPVLLNSIFGLILVAALIQGINNVRSNLNANSDVAFNEMVSYIKTNTDKRDVFAITGISVSSEICNSFIRKTGRENFVSHKMVAAEKKKLLEWYLRFQDLMKLYKDIGYLKEFLKVNKINYIMSNAVYKEDELELEYKNSSYFLYKILD